MNVNDGVTIKINDIIGKVFRHKRLFNYVVSPTGISDGDVRCHVGRNSYREFPVAYFQRDWIQDDSIDYNDLLDKVSNYPDQTPFTTVYDTYYEKDDGEYHSYIHFKDDMEEKMIRFPSWYLTTCTKKERNEKINPYTMIMPVIDKMEDEIQKDLDLMNTIRLENESIQIDDFKEFEFGLIKYLEKKYLRIV